MKKHLVLALLAAVAVAVPLLAQEPPFPHPEGTGEPAMHEGMQPPPGRPCGPGAREGMPAPQPGGPGGPGPAGMRPMGPPPEIALKEALGLSDEQVAALRSLLATRGRPSETQTAQLRDAESSLADALKGGSTDPAHLGTLLLKVEAARKQVEQPADAFRAAFAKLLTPAQQQKLDQIISLRKSLQAAEALQRLGV